MKTFRTVHTVSPTNHPFNYEHALFFIGSCFSTNMASYLSYRKFKVLQNPYGILFNPIAIFQCLEELIQLKTYTEADLIAHDELQHSFAHHTDFSGVKKAVVLEKINTHIGEAHQFLKESAYLFITLGTAWAYKYDGKIVANCHKIPNYKFEKVLLSVQELSEAFQELLPRLKALNPTLQIVFTVSPVRHLKDGFEENNLSKSILRTAIYQMQQMADGIDYFPAYEIMLDDLRDYRFYEKDLLHPNSTAVDYIWEQFKTRYVSEDELAVMTRIENLQAALHHRPKFESTEEHQKLLAFIKREQEALRSFFPECN